MGLSIDTPINFDVLLINTFITQLPVVFGELGCVSLAGVFERRFVISIATFELWFRETIVVFLGMIWGHWSLLCKQHIVLPCSVLSEGSLQVYHSCRHVMGWQSFFRLQDLMVMTTDYIICPKCLTAPILRGSCLSFRNGCIHFLVSRKAAHCVMGWYMSLCIRLIGIVCGKRSNLQATVSGNGGNNNRMIYLITEFSPFNYLGHKFCHNDDMFRIHRLINMQIH